MQVSVEHQNGNGRKDAGDHVHKPVSDAAADEAMLTEQGEDVAGKSFMAELVRGKKQLEMVIITVFHLLIKATAAHSIGIFVQCVFPVKQSHLRPDTKDCWITS